MTVAVVMAGSLPILFGTGMASEVVTRIAAPRLGAMVTAPVLSMLVVPAASTSCIAGVVRSARVPPPNLFPHSNPFNP
jgi:Cu/Ag efflux pump CusA